MSESNPASEAVRVREDIDPAREAAERLTGIRDVDYVTVDYRETVQCEQDIQTVAKLLLAILSRPADYVGELVGEPVWTVDSESPISGARWESIIGTYYICIDWDDESESYLRTCRWGCNSYTETVYNRKSDSIDAAKAACREDFLKRIAGELKSGKDTTHAD